ncbi:AAA family ATPase [Kineococcus sp. SYSU DK006]|uniref:AAA family ATPase n=1 Tax=Kineococcus sp. SYSU DK006 TaxID=3383127 RepID=UPI003D7EDEAE
MHQDLAAQLLLIGGRSGAGKTTVAYEVSAQLQVLGIGHCHIEGDNLDAAYPKAPDDPHGTRLTEANLAALWRNYRAIGHRRLLYINTASVLEPQMLVRAVRAAGSDDVEVVAVELIASDETVAARLAVRESGSELTAHLQRSRRMARLLAERAPAETVRVVTDGCAVTAVAADVIHASGWAVGVVP